MNDKEDFTQGSILKKLIAFMMPVLGALILQGHMEQRIFWWSEDLVRHQDFRQCPLEARY